MATDTNSLIISKLIRARGPSSPGPKLLPLAACVLLVGTQTSCRQTLDATGPSQDEAPAIAEVAETARATSSTDLVLTSDEREFLWDCENGGNHLGQQGFSPLSKAILVGEPAMVARFFSDDFRGSVPDGVPQSRWNKDSILISRVDVAESGPRPVNREQFVRWLLDISVGSSSGNAKSAGFELLSFSPESEGESEGDWRGRCRLRVHGEVDGDQPREAVAQFAFRTRAPTAELLAIGDWFLECDVTDVEIRESRHVLMKDVTRDSGLSVDDLFDNWTKEVGHRLVTTGGVYLCDFNRDGYTDVLVTSDKVPHNPRFYQGLPDARFEDITYRVGIPDVPGATVAAFADINNDGWEDLLFVGQGVFMNLRGKVFQNATLSTNLSQVIHAKGLLGVTGAAVADFDRDGLIDLYVTRADTHEHKDGSWIDGKSGNVRGNQLIRNLGGGRFEDVTESSGTSGSRRSTFTAAWLDANNDNWPDLYVIHEFGAGVLLVNQQDGSFSEQRLVDASQDFGSMGLTVGDIDNDGGIDVYVSNMYSKAGNRVMDNLSPHSFDDVTMSKLRRMVSGSELHVNTGDLTYQSIGAVAGVANVGWSWGAALVDLNNDGWLDIHSMAGFMSNDRKKPDG